MAKSYNENGELIEFQDGGDTVLNIQDLREKLANADGNPQVMDVLNSIIDYLEATE